MAELITIVEPLTGELLKKELEEGKRMLSEANSAIGSLMSQRETKLIRGDERLSTNAGEFSPERLHDETDLDNIAKRITLGVVLRRNGVPEESIARLLRALTIKDLKVSTKDEKGKMQLILTVNEGEK